MNKAYIEKLLDNKLVGPATIAAEGLRLLGYEIVWFDRADFDSLEITADTLVVGLINTYLNSLAQLGIVMENFDYPEQLSGWLGRTITRHDLGEIRRNESLWPIFMKPYSDRKAFTGKLVRQFSDLLTSSALPKDFQVVCSTPVHFISEYRCFVMKGEVLGCKKKEIHWCFLTAMLLHKW